MIIICLAMYSDFLEYNTIRYDYNYNMIRWSYLIIIIPHSHSQPAAPNGQSASPYISRSYETFVMPSLNTAEAIYC
jgi:hypothetical protein